MFGIVINKQGYKIEFVALNEDDTVQFYELKDNEQVIKKDWNVANVMIKPKWNFDTLIWEETATQEEIAEYNNNIMSAL